MAKRKKGSFQRNEQSKYDIFQLWAKNANTQMANIRKKAEQGKLKTPEDYQRYNQFLKAQDYLEQAGYKKRRKNQAQLNFPEGKDKQSGRDIREVKFFLEKNKTADDPFKVEADNKRFNTLRKEYEKRHPGKSFDRRDYEALISIINTEAYKNLHKIYSSEEIVDKVLDLTDGDDFNLIIKKGNIRSDEEQAFVEKYLGDKIGNRQPLRDDDDEDFEDDLFIPIFR